jgi:predicted dehydrogenase
MKRGVGQSGNGEVQLRFGIIGAGYRGSTHIDAINSFAHCRILGVCDVREKQLAAGVKRAGKKAIAYRDYQKLLANPDISAVLIATPNCSHKELVLAALQAGKHVVCEKPMALNLDECKAMKQAETRSDRVVQYTMQLRYSPRLEIMRNMIEQGKIGKPKHLVLTEFRGDWNRGDVWQYNDPKLGKINWRFMRGASGGTLSEKACHYFDILNWMAGSHPKRVSCTGGTAVYHDGRDTWDHATTALEYDDGIIATQELCMFGPSRFELRIIGEEASLFLDDAGLKLHSNGKSRSIRLPQETAHGERGPRRGHETAVLRMYEDFTDCVKSKKKPWTDADKAMASSKIAWLGELANDQKRQVQWDELR